MLASERAVVREEETSYTEERELFWARSCLDMHESSQLVYSHILTVFAISVLVIVTIDFEL